MLLIAAITLSHVRIHLLTPREPRQILPHPFTHKALGLASLPHPFFPGSWEASPAASALSGACL